MANPKILLSRDIASLQIDDTPQTLCIRHKSYPSPATLRRVMIFDDFAKCPREHLRDVERLIVVGLNSIISPSKRTEEVFEVLFNNTRTLPKISIDTQLFNGDRWRLWFHWGLTNSSFDGYTYSYLIESHFNGWMDGIRDVNPIDVHNVLRNSDCVVLCMYREAFQPLNINVIDTSAKVKVRYQTVKSQAFDECTTIRQIIARLGKMAQDECPSRRIPKFGELLPDRRNVVIATDLAVDTFLLSQLHADTDLCNAVASECFAGVANAG